VGAAARRACLHACELRGKAGICDLSLGVFYFLINVVMLYLTNWIVPQFTIATFWWGMLAATIVSAVNGLLHAAFGGPREIASI
jgi:uncharacterized membrane protein YvlD (DUF360 family)